MKEIIKKMSLLQKEYDEQYHELVYLSDVLDVLSSDTSEAQTNGKLIEQTLLWGLNNMINCELPNDPKNYPEQIMMIKRTAEVAITQYKDGLSKLTKVAATESKDLKFSDEVIKERFDKIDPEIKKKVNDAFDKKDLLNRAKEAMRLANYTWNLWNNYYKDGDLNSEQTLDKIKTEILKSKIFSTLSKEEDAVYDIDFGGNVLCRLKVSNSKIEVEAAMNGYGNSIPLGEINIQTK